MVEGPSLTAGSFFSILRTVEWSRLRNLFLVSVSTAGDWMMGVVEVEEVAGKKGDCGVCGDLLTGDEAGKSGKIRPPPTAGNLNTELWRPGVKGEAAGRKGEEGSRMGMWCGENGSWGEKGEGKPCWKGVGWTGWTGWWRRRGAGIWDFFLWV